MPRASLAAVFVALAALTLGGCNLVTSPTPVFAAADAAGAPALRPGVWAAPEKDCDFTPADSADTWPQCAAGVLVTPDKVFEADTPDDPAPYVLAAGDPRILQLYVDLSGLQPSSDHAPPRHAYFFMGVKPQAHDSAGRITRAEIWFIACGPPSPKGSGGGVETQDGSITQKPLPGMTLNDAGCSPKDQAALRGAVGPSRVWDSDHRVIHWLRDGDH